MSRHSRVLSVALLVLSVVVLWPTQASVRAQLPTAPSDPPTTVGNGLLSISGPSVKLPTEAPTISPHATMTATSTPTLNPSATTSITKVMPSSTPTATSAIMSAVTSGAETPIALSSAKPIENIDPLANTVDPALRIITQALNVGGFVLGLTVLGDII